MKKWRGNACNPEAGFVTDNPYLAKAKQRQWRDRWHGIGDVTIQPKRRWYRPYLPRIQRVTWHCSMLDDTSPHGSIRLFGWLRKERYWFLVETTGVAFLAALERGIHDRHGIDVTWLRSPDMRLLLLKLGDATRNPQTRSFVDQCLAVMDRINRVKHKFVPEGSITDNADSVIH